jgi:methylenetetrahydrofolate dehydrogenase (NADP+)/methenyltetrahydrofolate cyclohydrolase
MKLLQGSELAGYIKERQAKQVRNLRQSHSIEPKLAIVQTIDNEVIDTYVRMKQFYGRDIVIDVAIFRPTDNDLLATIEKLNRDVTIHGVIIQLPLHDSSQIEAAVSAVAPAKDVDGLSGNSKFIPATAMAIDWLLNGYNIELKNKKIAIVGNGRLVGNPLSNLWKQSGYNVTVFDEESPNVSGQLRRYNVIVSAAGVPGLITSQSVQPGAVVVDAATSAEHGKIIGDVADEVRTRDDLTITPEMGGVGPLTVCALFDNVIQAAQATLTN